MKAYPRLVLSDEKGKMYVHPELGMLGASNTFIRQPSAREIISLPKESTLFFMPNHVAAGYDKKNTCEVFVSHYGGKKVYPVSAFPIPGYTRLLLPAAQKMNPKFILPLWSYAAVGWWKGRFWVSAIQIDRRTRQRPHYYKNITVLTRSIKSALKRFPKNRLFKHLAHCASRYNCRAAQNLFFRRWEAPLPTSPSCNSRCLGCLSLQDSDCTIASHQRITFIPSVQEIEEVAVWHLDSAKEAIVSFGQGCEGEPLLQYRRLKASIIRMRQATRRGTIHLNTNAYHPQRLAELAHVGLDSVRISINSLHRDYYNAYYRPKGYIFDDVLRSIKVAKRNGLFVSLNLLVLPGLNDTPSEIDRLIRLLKDKNVDLLQMRNLCIDSDFYLRSIPQIKEQPLGILRMLTMVKRAVPRIRFGYFNVPKEQFSDLN